MATTMGSLVNTLQQIDFFQIALPFLFTFAVVYGILEKIELFGDADRVHAIVAVVAGLFVSRFVLVTGVDVPVLLSNYIGGLAIILLFIMAAMLVKGMTTGEGGGAYTSLFMYVGAVAAILLFVAWGGLKVIFPSTAGFTQGWFFESTTFVTLLVVLVALAAIAYIGGFIGGDGGADADEEGGGEP